jgi:shikimate 5-dehydrogenase
MKSTTEKIYGIVGCGIGYSLSPLIFNTLFKAKRLPAVYRLFDISPEGLAGFMQAAHLLRLDGFNVTIPFKEDVIEYLQKLDPVAAATGSVNLVLNPAGLVTIPTIMALQRHWRSSRVCELLVVTLQSSGVVVRRGRFTIG